MRFGKSGISGITQHHEYEWCMVVIITKELFKAKTVLRGPTEDIIHYFTLMSSELHYLDIIPKMENLTLMSSASGKITCLTPIFL